MVQERKDATVVLGNRYAGGDLVTTVRWFNIRGISVTKDVVIPPSAWIDREGRGVHIPVGTPDLPKTLHISLKDVLNGGGGVEMRKLLKAHGVKAVKPGELCGQGREKWSVPR